MRPHLNKKLGIVAYTYHPSNAGGKSRRTAVQAIRSENSRPYLKNN
jgi:hypothetical protein